MRYADLHLHTFHSDGVRSPREVVDLAVQHELRIIAISDHDNLSAIDEASEYAREKGILVVPAVELSTDFHGVDLHLLAYAFDRYDLALNERLAYFRKARLDRGERMVERLIAQGCPIRRERVLELCGNGSLGRPHLARALVESGVAGSIDQAFEDWLSPGTPGYVEKERFHVEEAIATVRRASGLTSVAHPTLYPDYLPLVDHLFESGVDAVEALHPEVEAAAAEDLKNLAKRRGKFITGGSDDHGLDRLCTIGSIRVPESFISPILARVLA